MSIFVMIHDIFKAKAYVFIDFMIEAKALRLSSLLFALLSH